MKYLFLFLMMLIVMADQVHACIVRYRPAEELKAEAQLVIDGEIVSLIIGDPSPAGELYTYKVNLVGSGTSTFEVVSYFNVRAREHNGILECPIKEGSGLETDLKVGSSYRLYLKSSNMKEILFTEKLN